MKRIFRNRKWRTYEEAFNGLRIKLSDRDFELQETYDFRFDLEDNSASYVDQPHIYRYPWLPFDPIPDLDVAIKESRLL
jgi:hypothetical protein